MEGVDASIDGVLRDAAPHIATLENSEAHSAAHDAAISNLLKSAAEYVASSESPFNQDLMEDEEDSAACAEAVQLAATLRGLRTPVDTESTETILIAFDEFAATKSGRQSLRSSHAVEAALSWLDMLCMASVPADAFFAVRVMASLTALTRACGLSRGLACKAHAERLTRKALSTWAINDEIQEGGAALLFALAFEDADDPAANALPPAPAHSATDDDDDVMAALVAALRRQQFDETADERTSVGASPAPMADDESALRDEGSPPRVDSPPRADSPPALPTDGDDTMPTVPVEMPGRSREMLDLDLEDAAAEGTAPTAAACIYNGPGCLVKPCDRPMPCCGEPNRLCSVCELGLGLCSLTPANEAVALSGDDLFEEMPSALRGGNWLSRMHCPRCREDAYGIDG